MSGKNLPAEKNVKKHVGAIHISNKLSLLERKMSNVLLWNAYEDLLKEEEHKIRTVDLAAILGYDSNDRALLKQSLVNLMSTVLEWNVLDEKGREKGWGATTMLAHAEMRGVYCYYSFGKKLKQKLYNPSMYERINLTIQKKFSSGYALALYENCVRYRNTGTTGWIPLEKYREIMGVNPKEYQDFRRLNDRVIKRPALQVNNSSDILIEPGYKREKRRVVAVRFAVRENPQMSLFGAGKSQKSNEELAEVPQLIDGGGEIRKKLESFGLTEEQVEWATASFDEAYIQGNLDVAEKEYKAGKIKNLPGYTMSALQKDYRPKQVPFEEEQKKQKRERRQNEAKKREQQEKLQELRGDFEWERTQNVMNQMSTTDYAAFEKRFHRKYKGDLLYMRFKDQGIQHPIIGSLFRSFAKETFLPEFTEDEFNEYAKRKGVSPEKGVITVT